MSFEHSKIRHGVINRVQVIIILSVAASFYFMRKKLFGGEEGLLNHLGFAVLLLFFGIYLLWQIIKTTEYTRIVTDEMIVFKSKGTITHQFVKGDIKKIDIGTKYPSITFVMRADKKVRLPAYYIFNLIAFYHEVVLCGYPANNL